MILILSYYYFLEAPKKVNTHIYLISNETDLIGRFYEAEI